MRFVRALAIGFAMLVPVLASAQGTNGRARPFEPGYFPGLDQPRVVATNFGVEVKADDRPMTVQWPIDLIVARTILIRNTTTATVSVSFRVAVGNPALPVQNLAWHPQSTALFIDPGATQPCLVYWELPGSMSSPASWSPGDHIDAPVTFYLTVRTPSQPFPEFAVTLPNTVEVIPRPDANPASPVTNAVIQSRIRSADGQPLANTRIELVYGLSEQGSFGTTTDASGQFSAGVFAYKRPGGSPSWLEFMVRRWIPPGTTRLESMPIVIPRIGETIAADVSLPGSRPSVNYQAAGSIDIDLTAYAYAASPSGDTIATVPFHVSGLLTDAEIRARARLSVFSVGGTLLWQYPINGATPAVDVSDDGSLIATTRQTPNPDNPFELGGRAIVLNRAGTVLLEVPGLTSNDSGFGDSPGTWSEVRISHDNQYLALGDSVGRLLFLERATGRELWRTFVRGMVRKIAFDLHDERLFVSGGDGWLRAYALNGTLLWKTWVDSWLPGMAVSTHYVLARSKANRSGLHLIDKVTGATRWSYQTDVAANDVKIAPDESYVYAASAGLNINSVFTIDGVPLMRLGDGAHAAAISADGRYFAYSDGCRLHVVDNQWRLLFQSDNLADPSLCGNNYNYMLVMSPDGTHIALPVVTSGPTTSSVHFFRLSGTTPGRKRSCCR